MPLSVGIWGHGRHLQTIGWEELVWGRPEEQRMGTLPMMAHSALRWRLDCVTAFGIGTGASQLEDGRYESEVMRDLFVERIQDLLAFNRIRNHPALQLEGNFERLAQLIRDTFTDVVSTNTAQEIRYAARFFTHVSVNEVAHVTCASHAPRCISEAIQARAAGIIPAGQDWTLIPDDMTFVGTEMSDVVIIEPPHRGDDPMRDAPIKPHEVFGRFFRLPSVNDKLDVLIRTDELMRSFGV